MSATRITASNRFLQICDTISVPPFHVLGCDGQGPVDFVRSQKERTGDIALVRVRSTRCLVVATLKLFTHQSWGYKAGKKEI